MNKNELMNVGELKGKLTARLIERLSALRVRSVDMAAIMDSNWSRMPNLGAQGTKGASQLIA